MNGAGGSVKAVTEILKVTWQHTASRGEAGIAKVKELLTTLPG